MLVMRGVVVSPQPPPSKHPQFLILLIVRGVISTGYEGGGEVGVALGEAPINPRKTLYMLGLKYASYVHSSQVYNMSRHHDDSYFKYLINM